MADIKKFQFILDGKIANNFKSELDKLGGTISGLNDTQVVVDFNENATMANFKKLYQKLEKENSDLTVQFRYDINKAMLQQAQNELSQLEVYVDVDKANKEILELVKGLKDINLKLEVDGITESDEDKLFKQGEEIADKIGKIISTHISIDGSSKMFDDLSDEVKEIIETFTNLNRIKDIKPFDTKNVEKQRKEIESIKSIMIDLEGKGAISSDKGGNINEVQIKEFRDEISEVKEDISSLKDRVGTLEDTTAFNNLSSQVEDFDDKIKKTNDTLLNLKNTIRELTGQKSLGQVVTNMSEYGRANEYSGELLAYSSSSTGYTSDIGISDSATGITKEFREEVYNRVKAEAEAIDTQIHSHPDNEIAAASYDDIGVMIRQLEEGVTKQAITSLSQIMTFDFSETDLSQKDLKDKMNLIFKEYYDFYDKYFIPKKITKDGKTYLDVEPLTEELENKIVNYAKILVKQFPDMDEAQLDSDVTQMLFQDKIKETFSKHGLGDVVKLSNLADIESSFSFSDIRKVADSAFSALTSQAKKAIEEGYADGQDSHSPSKEAEKLNDDFVAGVEESANKNASNLNNVGKQMADNIKEGFKEGISEIGATALSGENQSSVLSGNQTEVLSDTTPAIQTQEEIQEELKETQTEIKETQSKYQSLLDVTREKLRNDSTGYYGDNVEYVALQDFQWKESAKRVYSVKDTSEENYSNLSETIDKVKADLLNSVISFDEAMDKLIEAYKKYDAATNTNVGDFSFSNQPPLSSDDKIADAEQYKKISDDTVSVLTDIGKTETQIIEKIQQERKEAEANNEVLREHLVLLDKAGKVIANHWGSTSNVNGTFSEEQLQEADGGKIIHAHPGKSSFFGGKDLTHLLNDAMYEQIRQVELIWGDSSLLVDKSTLTKQSKSTLLNIMRNVRTKLTEMYGDNPDGAPSKEAREHINAIEKEIFKSVAKKLDVSVTETGSQAKEVTDALSDVDKAIIQRFKDIKSNVIQDINPSEIISPTTPVTEPIKDTFDVNTESSEMDKVATATDEAVQAKKDFATANEGVQDSVDGSKSKLELEAELMESIAKNARDAADAKREFVKANKEVKDSTDASNVSTKKKNKQDKKASNSTKYSGDISDYMKLLKEEVSNANLGYDKIEVSQGKSNGTALITFIKNLGEESEVTKIKVKDMLDTIDELQKGTFDISKYESEIKVKKNTTSKRDKETTVNDKIDSITSASGKIDTFLNYLKKDNVDTAQYEKLAKEFDDIINRQGKYAKSVNETTEETLKLEEATQSFANALKKATDKKQGNIAELFTNKIKRVTSDKNFDAEYSQIVRDIEDDIKKLEKNINIFDVNDIETAKELSRLIVTIDKNINKVKNVSNNSMHLLPEPEEISKGIGQINKILYGGYKLPPKLKSDLKELKVLYNNAFDGDGNVQITNAKFQELRNTLSKLNAEFEATGKHKSIMGSLTTRITDMNAKFLAQYFSFQDIVRYGQQAYQYVAEIDKQMIELEKVSDMSTNRLAESFEHATIAAKDLGSTVSDVISATADWSRLGYDADAAEQLAEVATVYKNVGDGIDISTANESLISTLQGFQMEASQAMEIVDSFNEVANRMPIDSAGIGEALQRSAAAFNASNTDLNSAISLITATNSVLQNPEKVGRMWTTVSARIRGAKQELVDAGEETDGMVESTSKLRDLVKGTTGFDIMADENTFKDMKEIIVGIGKEWNKLSDIDQAGLLEALAGKQQSNALAAALSNYEMIEEAYEIAENSAGSAMKEQEKWEQGLEARTNKLKASLETLSTTFLDSDFLGGLIDTGRGLIDILTIIIDKLGVIPTLLTAIGGGVGISKAIKGEGKRGKTSLFREYALGNIAPCGYIRFLCYPL